MAPTDDNLLKRLLATFKVEAREHIDAIAAGLIDLERASTDQAQSSLLDVTFRAAHSLKGAARTVNARDIESLCQGLENVFAALRRREIQLAAESFDLLHRVVAMLVTLLQFIDAPPSDARRPSVAELLRALHSTTSGRAAPTARAGGNATPANEDMPAAVPTAGTEASTLKRHSADTVRVATAKLDAVVLQAEELLAAKLAAAQQAQRLRRLRLDPADWKKR